MSNLKTYQSSASVKVYLKSHILFNPEKTFINMLRSDMKTMNMLDIGVGAGRTTEHFAPLVKSYFGIDYSESLIEACKDKFPNAYQFERCDVRDMSIFASDQFDIALFSFNGLDSISIDDRIIALKEIHRIIRNGGYFIFSSHNIQSVKELYRLHFGSSLFGILKNLIKSSLIFIFNGRAGRFKNKTTAIIKDGSHRFALRNLYIKPSEQVSQLKSLGFQQIKLYSIVDGNEIEHDKFDSINDSWIYYFSKVSK